MTDIHIIKGDETSTRMARVTKCCNGQHQTIAGALLSSKYWKDWYNDNMITHSFGVDETQETDAMSDEHFEAFIKFIIQHENKEYNSDKMRKMVNVRWAKEVPDPEYFRNMAKTRWAKQKAKVNVDK